MAWIILALACAAFLLIAVMTVLLLMPTDKRP
jgi:hypothetical protein